MGGGLPATTGLSDWTIGYSDNLRRTGQLVNSDNADKDNRLVFCDSLIRRARTCPVVDDLIDLGAVTRWVYDISEGP